MPSRRNRRKSPSPAPAPSASNGSSRDSSSLSPVRSRATMESDVDDGTPVTALEGIPDFDPEDLDTADMQAIGDGEGTEDVEEVEDADAVEDAEDEEEGEGEGGDDAEEVEGTEGGEQGDDAEESEGDGDDDEEEEDDDDEEEEDDDDDDKDDDDDEDDNDKDDEDEDKDDEEKDDDDEEGEEDEEETAEASASPTKPPSPLTFRYPPAVPDITTVSDRERAFKVARFIECTVDECDCSGLQPPSGSSVTVAAANDDVEMGDGTEADIGAVRTEEGWWRQCGVCSHGWEGDEGHVFAADVPDIERRRREKVVGRIEELLQDESLLTTFPTPEPESTESLRRQLSEFVRPSGKRPAAPLPRRFDLTEEGTPFEGTPFEDTEGEGDEEGRPRKRARLSADADKDGGDKAAENGGGEVNGDGAHHKGKKPAGKTSGKAKGTAARTVGGTAAGADPALQAGDEEDDDDDTPLAARRGPELDDRERRRRAEIKEKERAREDQVVSRAAKEGVAQEEEDKRDVEMWQGVELPQLPPRPAMLEQQRREIILPVVSSRTPTSVASILLIGLKNLFQKQLPKMPREYITRLVLDKNHISMPIVKRGWKVVGGICYRPFESRGFAEIVFCAVDSSEQVKGYGSHLMNALKDHVREAHPTINHFLTYADNYAVGYFKKQGFTKEISYPRERWVGYIKDYEGGTIMQCTMLPKVKYTEVHQMLADQKAAILAKIRTISKSHVVQPGLDAFKERKPGQQIKLSKDDIPGLTEAGWDPALDEIIRQPKRNPHFALLQQVLNDLQNDPSAWPFVKPVDSNVVTDYYNVIKNPMDLSTMEYKLDNNHYVGIDDFVADARLIFANCRQYNGEKNQYAVLANKLERSLDRIMKKRQAAIVT